MKTTDLMIGDWVQLGHFSMKNHKKVDAIDSKYMSVKIEGQDYCDCDIEPIPLTEEILKVNGCTPPTEYNLTSRFSYFIGYNDTYNVQMSTEHCSIGISIFYVHELQHALRLCGLDDLADNFKIE